MSGKENVGSAFPKSGAEVFENKAGCKDAADCLTRMIGDPEKARDKVHRLQCLMETFDEDEIVSDVEIFKAVADPSRLKVLNLLMEGEFCVCEIMTALGRPQSTTSHHLTILKDAGLVKERKEGKWCLYRLADGAVIEMIKQARLLKGEENVRG